MLHRVKHNVLTMQRLDYKVSRHIFFTSGHFEGVASVGHIKVSLAANGKNKDTEASMKEKRKTRPTQ